MGYEIERKFLVKGEYKLLSFKSYRIRQGYLSVNESNVVRVRTKGDKAYLTVKSALAGTEFTRNEWEYEIPLADADEMLAACESSVIDKTRYLVQVGRHVFEVDEFDGDNEGLVMAEVELKSEDEPFERPGWLGEEVTGDVRYYNAYLSQHPFKEWKDK